jgi:putative transposase
MSRRARVSLPGHSLHLTQRGNNRSVCFNCDEDCLLYLDILSSQAKKYECAVHAWCLMSNHVHFLVTPENSDSLALMMKGLGQRYVQYFNRTYGRSGTLWEGRYRSCLLHEKNYILRCQQYIEMNPVRSGVVAHPAEYRWSSYMHNAHGIPDNLLCAHPYYQALSQDHGLRLERYRDLFRDELDPKIIDQIRSATNGNYVLGSPFFSAKVEAALGRRVTRGKAGRPKRELGLDSSFL